MLQRFQRIRETDMKNIIITITTTIILASCAVSGTPISFQTQVIKFPSTDAVKSS